MVVYIFWFSILCVLYAYVGYPLLLWGISWFRTFPIRKGPITPRVSFIITAYNEEKRIEAKLQNTLQLIYPKEQLEILVASDCSTDQTDDIVQSYQPFGVTLVRAPERKGKENAQKYAVEKASGDILVFSDVATILEPMGVANIVQNFYDPTVGCVSSVDRFIDSDGRISGEGAYVRYEMLLRRLESQVNSLVGLSGSFFAARKEVCQPWATDLQSDFHTLLNAIKRGLRGVSDPDSIGYYKNIVHEKKEFERKVRTVVRGLSVFMRNLSLLNPFHYGLFSWQLFSHKLCRWVAPFFLLLAFISNLFLFSQGSVYQSLFFFQMLFYGMAISTAISPSLAACKFLKIPGYFVTVNLSVLLAWYRYAKGDRFVVWEPSQR